LGGGWTGDDELAEDFFLLKNFAENFRCRLGAVLADVGLLELP
jgi:hypothetical protein